MATRTLTAWVKVFSIKKLNEQSMLWLLGNNPPQEAEFFAKWGSELHRIRATQYARNQRNYAKRRQRNIEYARQRRIDMKSDPIRLSEYRAYCRRKMAERLRLDVEFRIRLRMRNRIWMSLQRGVAQAGPTVDMLGCTIPEFKAHIESRWTDGMSWSNYGRGGWHIDHKRPCESFDLTDPEQQKACFHYSNTQPLWQRDNLSKGAKFPCLP